jgi:hypothetical protein
LLIALKIRILLVNACVFPFKYSIFAKNRIRVTFRVSFQYSNLIKGIHLSHSVSHFSKPYYLEDLVAFECGNFWYLDVSVDSIVQKFGILDGLQKMSATLKPNISNPDCSPVHT